MSIADLTLNRDHGIRIPFDAKHNIHVQNFKTIVPVYGASSGGSISEGTSPAVINLFPEVIIQANKSLIIDTFVKAYVTGATGDTELLGLNVATNIKINGIWYSLGNSGRVVSANQGSSSLTAYVSKKYIDFGNLLNRGYVKDRIPYTVQVELSGSCHEAGSISVNGGIDAGGTIPPVDSSTTDPGPGVVAVADQNFTTVIIEETD